MTSKIVLLYNGVFRRIMISLRVLEHRVMLRKFVKRVYI